MLEKKTAEQRFMEILSKSVEEMLGAEYAKKVEVLGRKLDSANAAVFMSQEKLIQVAQGMTPQEIADGQLDVYIKTVRLNVWKVEQLITKIGTIRELVGGVDNETEK